MFWLTFPSVNQFLINGISGQLNTSTVINDPSYRTVPFDLLTLVSLVRNPDCLYGSPMPDVYLLIEHKY